jgi:hypothetical protein
MQVSRGKQHYKTWHGKIGLFTCISTAILICGGAASFRKLGIIQRFPESKQGLIKRTHRIVGPVVLCMALFNSFIQLNHHAIGGRLWLHMFQKIGVVLLALSELYVLWGSKLLRRLGWCSSDKAV